MTSKSRAKPSQSRLVAYELIRQVAEEGAYANLALPALLQNSTMDERDRAFTTELSYGTLRMQGKYDSRLRKYIDRDFSKVDAALLNILRMGMHEIISMRTPEHAAVSQTVDLARSIVGESTGAFANAILRSALRDIEAISYPDELSRFSNEYSHPLWIVQSFYDIVKDWNRVEAILQANNEAAKPNLVAWPGLSDAEELMEVGGSRIPETRYGVEATQPPHVYPAIRDRRAGVQDRGSQIIGELFLATAADQTTKLSWLDMCAGPGGKAAYLFHSLREFRPLDTFLANEISQHRADLIAQVIPRENVSVGAGQDLAAGKSVFDRILVDAPCTGLGALRRRPEARWRKTQQDLKELVAIQRELLDSAATLLAPEGLIAYVTCSPHLAETRLQVADFLYRHKDFEVQSLAPLLSASLSHALYPDGSIQLWSDLDNSDAMFIVLFKRKVT